MQDQHPVLLLTAQPSLLGVRGVHRLEGDLVIVQEPVQALQLPLGSHGLGEAETRVATKVQADALQAPAAARVAERCTSILRRDVLEAHRGALITSRGKKAIEMCGNR